MFIGTSTIVSRQKKRGVVLISTLITLLLLATVVIAVQQKSQANLQVMAKLTDELEDQSSRNAVYERFRGLVADAMTGTGDGRPKLNSDAFLISEGDRQWSVQVQDVEGLVDVYLSPPEILALLPIDASALTAARERALLQLEPGERFPVLAASLARFGTDVSELAGMVTQSSQSGSLRLATLPHILQTRASGMPPSVRDGEQVVRVTVSIQQSETSVPQ